MIDYILTVTVRSLLGQLLSPQRFHYCKGLVELCVIFFLVDAGKSKGCGNQAGCL